MTRPSPSSALRFVIIALSCALSTVGCTAPWSAAAPKQLAVSHARGDSLPAPPLESGQSTALPQHVATAKPASPIRVLTTEEEIALNNLVAEVRSTMELSPAAEHQLRTELRAARADDWPGVVKHFRSTLAYKQELLAREARQGNVAPIAATNSNQFPPLPSSMATDSEVTHALDRLQAAVTDDVSTHVASVRLASHSEPVPPAASPEPTATRGTTIANRVTEAPATIQQVAHAPSAAGDGQAELSAAIATLEQEVKAHPGTTAELQDHLRLRMLMLMAGRESDSFAPIPGASPAEQDYWSKQLFALSTYLDAQRVPDTKQRAAGALIHFDAARAKLAELATLQVRHLTFVDEVDGYGLYEPRKDSKFSPGEQVTLYAEVDNYTSESTKEGYRTVLSTSYEVVDRQGQRVDGAQFPDVEDICRNLRRDFHMQYGVTLPTRIYAGEYELRLIITDQLSHKIGQASVRFEIAE